MTIFASGVPVFLASLGMENRPRQRWSCRCRGQKVFVACCISVAMNTIFAPVFMTLHKVTDTHILATGGTLRGFFTPLHMGDTLAGLDWHRQWNFVFKKTIPLFLVPGPHGNVPAAGRRKGTVRRAAGSDTRHPAGRGRPPEVSSTAGLEIGENSLSLHRLLHALSCAGRAETTGCSAVRLAHLLWEQGVVGSNPATPTSLRNWQLQFFRLFHLRFPYPFYRHTLGNE